MDQILEFFRLLFSSHDWPPRWFCGYWSEFHGWLYILSDLAIWLSYFAIPIFLLAFIYRKPDVPLPRVFWLFTLFILACGLTHLMDAIIFWWPAYRLSALIRFITALISVSTFISLFKVFPQALNLTTSAQFDRELQLRKEAERKLQLNNQLLQAKNEEIKQLSYAVSHDLKSPVNSFSQILFIIKAKLKELNDSELDECFRHMDSSTDRMRLMIDDMLTYSSLDKRSVISLVDLNPLLQDVVNDLKAAIDDKKAIINIPKMPSLHCMETKTRMLFQNLLANALKFQRPGSQPQVDIEVSKTDAGFEFAVRDNGIGIEKKNLVKIFDVFQRLHAAKSFEGSGIGLAHCKKIVQMHGGEIWATSDESGTTFHFTIPDRPDLKA